MRRPIHCEGLHSLGLHPDGKTGKGTLNSSPRWCLLPDYGWYVISHFKLLLLPCPHYDGVSFQSEGQTKILFLKSLLAGYVTTAAGELITPQLGTFLLMSVPFRTQVKISLLTGPTFTLINLLSEVSVHKCSQEPFCVMPLGHTGTFKGNGRLQDHNVPAG